jgi:hypothetical protein
MYCYVGPPWRTSVFELMDRAGHTLASIRTLTEGSEPHYFGQTKRNKWGGFDDPSAGYPAYEIETVNGITEAAEFKRMEPVFYINDDPAVRTKLGIVAQPKTIPPKNDR